MSFASGNHNLCSLLSRTLFCKYALRDVQLFHRKCHHRLARIPGGCYFIGTGTDAALLSSTRTRYTLNLKSSITFDSFFPGISKLVISHFEPHYCQSCASFSTSSAIGSRRQAPVIKQPEKPRQVINIWKNMTVSDFASSVNRPLGKGIIS
jgi:hypothetical protein